ncbi:hypothetical protein SNE40_023438 [Patella caerulea]|uniref:Integrase catalytic domain-containing protein n=1 Tax=Patella caerulea TaxID=87958 RepID=A0AAN8G327_PATCE
MMKLRTECLKFSAPRIKNHLNAKFEINRTILVELIESGFTVVEISKLLSVSERTIYRRMAAFNISVYDFSDIEDDILISKIDDVLRQFPRNGETMVRAVLQECGIKITRSRLRNILHEIDRDGIKERRRGRLHRRVYNVQAPMHLWHLDTNHKLIRWHFVIAGGIDGFSRFVVFLNCIGDNKADTIFRCFKEATGKYGTPLRVRSDQGMENFKVAESMLQLRGPSSMITGKSTHNQRIERLWRDVFEGVLAFYYELFYFLEERGILDPLNEVHLYAIHYVYLLRINSKLEIWKNAWARHRLRTVGTSPLRLFLAGSFNLPVPPVPMSEDNSHYGVEGQVDIDVIDNPRPQLNPINLNAPPDFERQLFSQYPVNRLSENHGIDLYMDVVRYLNNLEINTNVSQRI